MALIWAVKNFPFAKNDDDAEDSDRLNRANAGLRSLNLVLSFSFLAFLTYTLSPPHACLFFPCYPIFFSPHYQEVFQNSILLH